MTSLETCMIGGKMNQKYNLMSALSVWWISTASINLQVSM